jgi:peroxiredoxin
MRTNRIGTIVCTTLVISAFLFSCTTPADQAIISGVFTGLERSWLYISRPDGQKLATSDSVRTSSRGRCRIKLKVRNPEIISLSTKDRKRSIVLLVEPGDNITLTADGSWANYNVHGSKGSGQVKLLHDRLSSTRGMIDSLWAVYEQSLQEPKFDSIKAEIDSSLRRITEKHRQFTLGFIADNPYSLASILALYQEFDSLHPVVDYPNYARYYNLVDSCLYPVYPHSPLVTAFHSRVIELKRKRDMAQQSGSKYRIGDFLPSMQFALTDGRVVSIPGVWARFILIDFYGAWCKQCEGNATSLKSIYKEFQPKGLVVIQVALSEDAEAHQKRIERDSLAWMNPVVPDPDSSTLISALGIKTIPANYLIDRWGRVFGVNLHGDRLNARLKQLLP